jgi:hypothetical protein
MTDEELEARILEMAKDLGGLDAILASLDGSCAWHRQLRQFIRDYQENGFRRSP